VSGLLVAAQSFPGLVLLGFALLASLNLFYRDRPMGQDPLHLTLTVIGRVMIVTGFLEACLLFLNPLAIPFGVLVVGIVTYVAFRYWLRRRMALLTVMAAAARRSMPLAPAVEAFSHEWGGGFRRRCLRLAESLGAGVPLGEALRQAGSGYRLRRLLLVLVLIPLFGPLPLLIFFFPRRLVPRRAAAMIEVGERCGNLSGGLQEAVRQPASQPTLARVLGAAWYLGAFILAATLILMFVMIKIVPAFIKIFDDFEADLPAITLLIIDSCDWFVRFGWLPLLATVLGVGGYLILWLIDVVAWLPWPLNRISRRLQTAAVLRSLAVAADTSRPLEPALAALAEHYPSLSMRGRLAKALAQTAMGVSWTDSLADQKLLRPGEVALLTSAVRVGNLPWALREAADGIERRFALRLQGGLEVVVPALVLAAGTLVMFIIVGLFVPLISLIEKLT
jgi:hypothetical protein